MLAARERIRWSWVWAGKMLATLFALTQAVGTIVMWVRRMDSGDASCFGFDHRNGAMGISSTICSVGSIFILLLRYDWSVPRVLESSSTEKLHASRTTLILHTFLAMTLHLWIAWLANDDNGWLYTSSGLAFLLSRIGSGRQVLGGYQAWIKHRSWKRIKALLKICLVLWFIADIVKLLVHDIIETIKERDDDWFWWQDPISDKIFVI
jgi:hypothetical protein